MNSRIDYQGYYPNLTQSTEIGCVKGKSIAGNRIFWFKNSLKGGDPAPDSPRATLFRLNPHHWAYLSTKNTWYIGYSQLCWPDGQCVQDPRTYSPWYSWPTITSDSNFMRASCSPQSELRPTLRDSLHISMWLPIVLAIVAPVLPEA